VAGNLAWQAQALGFSQNLRRSNVYARLSWQSGAWQPALDMLYNPADRGRVVTASLSWQGDRVQVQGSWRAYGGPADAVLAQLPARRLANVTLTWAF
jgi:Tfp pilus assembly protein PilN